MKEPNDECVAWNPKIPAVATGTYKVSMRRTTGDDRVAVWAGMWFGQTTQDAFRNHYWVHLRLDHTDCSGEPSVLWFGAVVNDSSVMWRDKCNDDIRTDANDWNDLKIIRGNGRVKIYVNGTLERDDDDSYLPGPGWFDLVGVSNWSDTSSSNPVVIEFDNFSVTTAITP